MPIMDSYFYKVDPDKIKLEHTCSVYVPAYSHVYLSESQTASLGITLSIRNIDSKRKIYITQVEYYDTHGMLTDTLTTGLFALEPMATASYVIAQDDMRGGVGANFIVRWAGDKQMHPPIIEAIMVGNVGTKGYSFSSRGENISCNE
ncbi:MAG: DUF3124 domain-containing protein [Methylomonas sp.]|jgi:hypothetical protein|uniref:DUF3124 domain-containing protein n=1 Tax=Methylomonas sp. TaxID=418 RepID=UPI0025F641D3|nr:DUF3124 domain-containing protein [Methylomonas sp.]MCK9606143.1 DUF3124 domain-containing protein [Methylomonas sp.]